MDRPSTSVLPARPLATYRLQLQPAFGFDDAAAVAGYLAELGVSHLYASPYLQAAAGSTHGYDVVDPTRVNVELGGAEAHQRMCRALGDAGLGQVLDVVPNHMAITGRENAWWWDVLENGPSSVYANYFDVDWDPPEAKLRNTVLLPVLGDHYGRVLEAGQLVLGREGGSFIVRYFDHDHPVAPRSIDSLLESAAARLPPGPDRDGLESVAAALGRLPPSWATDTESVRERHRDKEVLRCRLEELCEEHGEVAAAVDAEVAAVNADLDRLDDLLDRQNYRLAFWRTAGRELDYRRFFDISHLVGLRVEDEEVFDDSHRLVLGWLEAGVLDGLRIDHPDGLADPQQYLARLAGAAPRAWVVVEKILEPGERLRAWPVAGTTGYDFLNRVGGLFVDGDGEEAMSKAYAGFTGEPVDFEAVAAAKKRLALRQVLAADLNRLTELAVQICERHRRYRDYTRYELREVLAEVLASYPVYRTYVVAGAATVDDADVVGVDSAVGRAIEQRPDLDPELFAFVRDLLLLRIPGELEGRLAMGAQQLTGPVMAKGVEDTAFYTYNRLTSLNEVGGDPGRFGVTVAEFHSACLETAKDWPTAMSALSTHDTKRSEDVRARLALLSEMPERWAEIVARWSAHNARHRRPPVDANVEWLLYQTLVGAWPLTVERAVAYMAKASKEAKVHTSWVDPVPEYDRALQGLVEAALDDATFVAEVEGVVSGLVGPGRVNALAQKLLQLTAPGVPDLYQGSELWDLSLVDPDNRRPVDFGLRRRLLGQLASLRPEEVPEEVMDRADEGLPKLLVVHRALAARRNLGDLGAYRPLPAGDHVVAFERAAGLVTVVPRLVLGERWRDEEVELPEGRWHNLLTTELVDGGPRAVTELLARFPVALLVRG